MLIVIKYIDIYEAVITQRGLHVDSLKKKTLLDSWKNKLDNNIKKCIIYRVETNL